MIVASALVVALTLLPMGAARLEFVDGAKSAECAIHENEPIHEVMERICEMCHEFSSHSRPNMRSECRAECFSTEIFRECLRLFTPRRHTRHHRI